MHLYSSLLFIILILQLLVCSADDSISPQKLRSLYNSLEPTSINQHLAFYELYPDSEEGQNALNIAWRLLSGENSNSTPIALPSINASINALIALINRQPKDTPPQLSQNDLDLIEKISCTLANRKLQGFYVRTEEDLMALPSSEIDLARGLFLSQFGSSKKVAWNELKTYESYIDLMALQIRARLPVKASPEQIIDQMNRYIFFEMGFRFPPHSLYAKEIDLYTFLPSVLDSHRGVCLGVSILYLAIAQRLSLPLEVITPPGHIFLRYNSGNRIINIETTARGVHIDCDEYLGLDTIKLQKREIKEVIGMANFNQAAAYLAQNLPGTALKCYEKACLYHPEDMLTKEYMGYCCILAGQEERGRGLLMETRDHIPDFAVSGNSTASDYLEGNADNKAIEAMLMHVDETRESILAKQKALQLTLKKFPKFKSGWFALAASWMQLHRCGEALETLAEYHELDPNDPTVEYYLAALYAERFNFPKAWSHLRSAEAITAARGHYPKALKELRKQLQKKAPG